jgi:hypothetical protein
MLDEFFAAERNTATAAVAAFDVYFCLIEKFQGRGSLKRKSDDRFRSSDLNVYR